VSHTVLIVDDHDSFRRFAKRVLEAGGLTVIGEAADAKTAIRAAAELEPDVVLLDIKLPDGDGFTVAEQIAGAVVLTSSHELDDLRTRLDRSRARGFVPKDDLTAEAVVALLP
jgi:DNA-binding NarL/FixJ family response regulator